MTLVKVGTSYETHGICEGGLTLSDCFPTESAGKWEIYPEGSLRGGTVIENRFSPKVDNGSQQENDAGGRGVGVGGVKRKEHIIMSPEQGCLHPGPRRRGRGRVAGEF